MSYVNEFIRANRVQPGDVIVVKKTIFLDHYVVYLGLENFCSRHLFSANLSGEGVVLIQERRAFEFLSDYKPTRIRRLTGGWDSRVHAVRRAYKLLGKKYDFLGYNCEHYVNEVQGIGVTSQQVQLGTLGVLAVGVALAFSTRRK